jgi:transposase
MYESRRRTRREQLLASQRCSSASAGTRSSAGEDARERHLLPRHRDPRATGRRQQSLRTAIEKFDGEIAAVYATHPDRFLIESLPGAGSALEPRLLAALGTDRGRFRSAGDMACCFGIAPVTASSGNSRWVHWRWACSKFVRQTFHEWAACTVREDGWARDHYERQRAKGKGHHAAVRSVAYKWIRILYRCWRDRVPYSEQRYLEALRTRGAAKSKPTTNAAEPSPGPLTVQWKNCGGFSKP